MNVKLHPIYVTDRLMNKGVDGVYRIVMNEQNVRIKAKTKNSLKIKNSEKWQKN